MEIKKSKYKEYKAAGGNLSWNEFQSYCKVKLNEGGESWLGHVR